MYASTFKGDESSGLFVFNILCINQCKVINLNKPVPLYFFIHAIQRTLYFFNMRINIKNKTGFDISNNKSDLVIVDLQFSVHLLMHLEIVFIFQGTCKLTSYRCLSCNPLMWCLYIAS